MEKEINIIVDDDKCWLLNTTLRLVTLLEKNNFHINSIWVLPNKLSKLKGVRISLWYLRIFGFYNFVKMSIFYLIVLFKNFNRKIFDFNDLGFRKQIQINKITSFNDENFLKLLKNKKIKYNLIFTNHIIPSKILNLRNNFFINKHASLLPSFQGLMPYIRTKIANSFNGISIHLVTEKIDIGRILFQIKFKKDYQSMIDFYLDVFNKTPKHILESIKNLENNFFIDLNTKLQNFLYQIKLILISFVSVAGI